MSNTTTNDQSTILKKIKLLYRVALFCYLFPILFLFLFVIDTNFLHITYGLFFVLFLISLLPFSITGAICTVLGLRLSRKNNLQNKNTGYTNLVIGAVILISSIIGLAIFFYMAF